MLDNLVSLVKNYAIDAISKNTNIPDDKRSVAAETVTHSMVSGLEEHLNSGKLEDITKLFSGGSSNNNPIVSSMISSVASGLASKVGLNSGMANTVANSIVPMIMGMLSKNANSGGGFNVASLIESVTKNKGGLMSSLGKLFGK